MNFEVKNNETGKLTAGSIVYFYLNGSKKKGIVTASNSSRDIYHVAFIGYANKKKNLSTIKASGKAITDSRLIVEKDYFKSDRDVYNVLEKINEQILSNVPPRTRKLTFKDSPTPSMASIRKSSQVSSTSRKAPQEINYDSDDDYIEVDGGYRAKSIRRRSKKNRRKTKRNRRKH